MTCAPVDAVLLLVAGACVGIVALALVLFSGADDR